MNLKWALLVEGTAAQMYRRHGGAWHWCMIREDAKRPWRSAAKGCLRRGIKTGFGSTRHTPKTVQ